MRIVQVIDHGYIAGGAEKCAAILKSGLKRKGHEVLVISGDFGNPREELTYFGDVEFPSFYNRRISIFQELVEHLWYPRSYSALRKEIYDFRPDIVHFHTIDQSSPSVLFAIGKVPAIHTVHSATVYTSKILEWAYPQKLLADGTVKSTYYTPSGRVHALYNRYLQRPIYKTGFKRSVKTLVAPSKYMAATLEKERFGVPIQQIYNGIPLPRPAKLHNREHILFVGRLDYVKGVHVLLQSVRTILESVPGAHLDIVGDGPLKSDLDEFVKDAGIAEHVTFHGWLSGNSLSKMYRMSTVVVVPSLWPDNLPTVCIEALANGRPVVGSDTGGIPEMIEDGITGKVVPPNDPSKLAAAVIALLMDEKLSSFAERCSLSAQRFRVDKFVDNHEKLYEKVIEQSARRANRA